MKEFLAVFIPSFCALLGTIIGTLGGIRQANKLTVYRIEQLEQKVDKHNNVIERTFKLQADAEVLEEKIKVASERLDKIEKKVC